ncbi:unnamed protein product [Effrenium voratum]|uniref:Calcineurin-like phosphoesterase domain-containing protein n=1 Tax=Effrenium voratum TaxID=2562239 RepID=A0AA36J9K9_9DINO|nr:unnamed protein product [Effrenium voratum]
MAEELPDSETLRILVLTDTHVGFNEKDKVRGKDSMETLEEALQIGKSSKADLILHGGDLFHENKPSRGCLYRTMDLLRKYTLGSGEVGGGQRSRLLCERHRELPGPEPQRGVPLFHDPRESRRPWRGEQPVRCKPLRGGGAVQLLWAA